MRRALLVAVALVAVAAGCGGGGTETVTEVDTVTVAETETVTETAPGAEGVLPEAVAETHAALLAAASSGDYEQLRPLVPEGLSYTFGGEVEGGAIAYWQRLEEEGRSSPIAVLAGLLELPPAYYGGVYVWPFAFPLTADELTPEDRELLRDVGGEDLTESFPPEGGYLGWRVGIDDDGTWLYFIAGD